MADQPATRITAPDAPTRSFARPVLFSAGIAVVWAALAWRQPTITYHFGPLLVAASLPLAVRVTVGPRHAPRALFPAAVGLVIASVTTATLGLADALRGPVLVGANATVESLLFAFVGATWGWRTLHRHRPGLVVRALMAKTT